jgi:hypothetical protein
LSTSGCHPENCSLPYDQDWLCKSDYLGIRFFTLAECNMLHDVLPLEKECAFGNDESININLSSRHNNNDSINDVCIAKEILMLLIVLRFLRMDMLYSDGYR